MRVRRALFSGALALFLAFAAVAAAESNDAEHHDGATMLATPSKVLGTVGRVLHRAAKRGMQLVREIVKRGIDSDSDGDIPLHRAVEEGGTPLHRAVVEGTVLTIRSLLDSGADSSAETSFGRTPLHWAARIGREAVVSFLLVSGASKDATDSINCTPLHWAVYTDHDAMVKLLLDAGADKDAKNVDGQTPLDLAESMDLAVVARTLLAAGAKHGDNEHAALASAACVTAAAEESNATARWLEMKMWRVTALVCALIFLFLALIADQSPKLARRLSYALLALMEELIPNVQLAAAVVVLFTGALYIHDRLQARRVPVAAPVPDPAIPVPDPAIPLAPAPWAPADPVLVTVTQGTLVHVVEADQLTAGEQLPFYLFYAARSGHEALVQLLLESGKEGGKEREGGRERRKERRARERERGERGGQS
jgi:ankyrin repeat protein